MKSEYSKPKEHETVCSFTRVFSATWMNFTSYLQNIVIEYLIIFVGLWSNVKSPFPQFKDITHHLRPLCAKIRIRMLSKNFTNPYLVRMRADAHQTLQVPSVYGLWPLIERKVWPI